MLIYFFEWLDRITGGWPGAGLMDFISFRAGVATIISLIISMLFGGHIIDYLRKLQVGETVRDLGLAGQLQKQGTPTMGGVIIIMAILIPCLLLAELDNVYVVLLIVATTWMGIIGFIDDYIKVFLKDKKGLKGWFKVLGQVGLGLIVALAMIFSNDITVRMYTSDARAIGLSEASIIGDSIPIKSVEAIPDKIDEYRTKVLYKADYKTNLTNVPFLKGNQFDYAWLLPFKPEWDAKLVWLLFVPVVIIIVIAVSNAANLTDGLDGLATGVSGIVVVPLGILAYLSGNAITSDYLNILYLPGAGEMTIFAACFLGACLGFLWYNSFPASIFMGDTGSLTLGGIIATMAILLRKELLIPLLCGVFLAESLSVIIQVSYFKYTKRKYGEGRRVFKMSPLHHHYQKLGMSEVKIVSRFWLVAILLAVAAIITLKVR